MKPICKREASRHIWWDEMPWVSESYPHPEKFLKWDKFEMRRARRRHLKEECNNVVEEEVEDKDREESVMVIPKIERLNYRGVVDGYIMVVEDWRDV